MIKFNLIPQEHSKAIKVQSILLFLPFFGALINWGFICFYLIYHKRKENKYFDYIDAAIIYFHCTWRFGIFLLFSVLLYHSLTLISSLIILLIFYVVIAFLLALGSYLLIKYEIKCLLKDA